VCPSQPWAFIEDASEHEQWFVPLAGGTMQRVNEFLFYELALKVHALATIPDGDYSYREHWLELFQTRSAVTDIGSQRSLHFSVPSASRLHNAISAIVPANLDELLETWDARTAAGADIQAGFLVSEIREAAKDFETSLRTECQLMDTYFISKKGTYSTKDLVDNAHFQIPEPSRSELPEQAKLDLDQAGKCIAFDVPTAAAFHLLRATESVIRDYYQLIVPGTKQANPKMRNWGVYIKLMKAHGGDKAALSILDHMRDVYRNPVTHPEENYTDEKVQVLFGLCVSAICLILGATRTLNTHLATMTAMLNFPATP